MHRFSVTVGATWLRATEISLERGGVQAKLAEPQRREGDVAFGSVYVDIAINHNTNTQMFIVCSNLGICYRHIDIYVHG